METGAKRRLAAILFADVADYSRLIGEDEVGIATLVRKNIGEFVRLAPEYSGQLVDTAGDGVFLIFDSAVDAVNFAVNIQKHLNKVNKDEVLGDQIKFRIGINLGDVLMIESKPAGEAINVAARIESFTIPGRICISGSTYESVKSKMSIGYEYLGPQRFKNIKDETDVFLIHENPTAAAKTAGLRKESLKYVEQLREPIIDQSIVVLPFLYQGGDPEDRWFADGLTEDITTNLSRFKQFFVISRNSAYVYQDKPLSPKEIASKLGVRYVVSGSVRKSGSRIRITVHLLDVILDRTLWGEQYNKQFDDLFDIQDEITQVIVAATAAKIEATEIERARLLPPSSMAAYGYVLQGQSYFYNYTQKSISRARQFYDSALINDPEYARALAAKSRTLNLDWLYNWTDSPEDVLDTALDLAMHSVSNDATDARGFGELGFAHLYRKEHDASIAAYERALTLNPNDAELMSDMGDALAHCGRSEEAVELLEKAMQLNPFYPDMYLWHLGGAYFNMKEYELTIQTVKRMQNPTEGRRLLAASYGHLDMKTEATAEVQRLLEDHPNFDYDHWTSAQPDKFEEDVLHFADGLKRAGLK